LIDSDVTGLFADSKGNLLATFTDVSSQDKVVRIDPAGMISTVAGVNFEAGAKNPFVYTRLAFPYSLVADNSGSVYVLESDDPRTLKYSPSGLTSISTHTTTPTGLAIDGQGNIYVADSTYGVVNKIDSSGQETRFAGIPQSRWGLLSSGGDGGPAI